MTARKEGWWDKRSGLKPALLWRVDCLLQARAEVRAERGEILHGAQRDELARDVADGGAFEAERDDRHGGGVRGRLAEQAVFRAAADDQDALEFLAGHFFERAHGVGMAAA